MLCRDAPVWHTATLAVRRIRIRITIKEIGNNMAPRKGTYILSWLYKKCEEKYFWIKLS